MSARAVLSLVLVSLLAVGCTRSRSPRGVSPTPAPAARSASDLVITAPAPGTRVTSPIAVTGTVGGTAGRPLAAVVYRRAPDGSQQWRGNGPLSVANGGFTGTVSYTLEAGAPGVVEVMLVDPVSGTVLDRQSVPVELQPAP